MNESPKEPNSPAENRSDDEVLGMLEHFFPGIEIVQVDGETILREVESDEPYAEGTTAS